MYKYFKIGMLFVVMLACAQHKKPIGPNETKFKNIPNDIKKFKPEEEIGYYIYSMRVEREAMEIYINDMPYKKLYKDENSIVYFPINEYILKSGTQKVRVKYSSITGKPFGPSFYGAINIKKVLRSQDFSEGKKIVEHETPRVDNDGVETFVGKGLMEYEESFAFEATVPYEHVGWSESEDLSKMDAKELEKQAVAAYQNIIDTCKRKDREALFGLFYQLEFEKAESKYFDEELFKKFTGGYDFVLEDPSVKFYPLEDYKMELYGNGKVVALESTKRLGESPIRFDIVDIDQRTGKKIEGISNLRVLLHKPKGSDVLIPIH